MFFSCLLDFQSFSFCLLIEISYSVVLLNIFKSTWSLRLENWLCIKIITVDWHCDVASQWVRVTCANCIIAPSTTHQWDGDLFLLDIYEMHVMCLIIVLFCGMFFHSMLLAASSRTWGSCIKSVARKLVLFIWDPWIFTSY